MASTTIPRTVPRLAVDVLVEDERWAGLGNVEALAERAVLAAAAGCGVVLRDGAEVSVLLAADAAIRVLNAQWRGQDKATNVLSFPAVAPAKLSDALLVGDIALGWETVAREAQSEAKTTADHATHLIVHGFLHLVGHDHLVAAEAERMENLERRILGAMGIADPYRDDT